MATLVGVKLVMDILVQRSLGAFLFMFTYCMPSRIMILKMYSSVGIPVAIAPEAAAQTVQAYM